MLDVALCISYVWVFSRGGLVIERLHIGAVFMTVVGRFPVATAAVFLFCVILLCRRRSEVICFESHVLSFFNQTQTVFVNVICYNLVQICIL